TRGSSWSFAGRTGPSTPRTAGRSTCRASESRPRGPSRRSVDDDRGEREDPEGAGGEGDPALPALVPRVVPDPGLLQGGPARVRPRDHAEGALGGRRAGEAALRRAGGTPEVAAPVPRPRGRV